MEDKEIEGRLKILSDALHTNNLATAELQIISRNIHELLKDIKGDVDHINKHIFLGNGQPAIVHRLAVVETGSNKFHGDLEKLSEKVDEVQKSCDEMTFSKHTLNRNTIVCLVGIVLMWVTLLVDYVYSSDLTKTIVGVFR